MKSIFSSPRYRSILFLLLASILWSTGGILIKLVNWNPIAIAGSRSFISMIVILLYLRKPIFTWSKAQLGGAIAYASTVILFVYANKLTTAANAILLQFTAPIYVAILGAWLLKEKIKWYDYLAMIAVFGGMMLFFIDNTGAGSMLGNTLAVISGFFLACVTIALRYQKDGSPVETTLIGNFFTFIAAIPFIIGKMPDVQSIIGIILLGTFQLAFAYILYALAIKHLSALEAILITVIEPLLNPVWVYIFAGEKPSLYAVLGGLVVISAVTVRSIIVTKESAKHNKS